MNFRIRPYQASDRTSLYHVCLKTGDAGRDATELLSEPDLLGDIYVEPYLQFEPGFCFTGEDDLGVCAYVLSVRDVFIFHEFLMDIWYPRIRQLYPPSPAGSDLERKLRHLVHQPLSPPQEFFRKYPAEMHIDLLERAQGRGNGRQMVETLLSALMAEGCPGIHLGMHPQNDRARQFYLKLGFTPAPEVSTDSVFHLVKKLNKLK